MATTVAQHTVATFTSPVNGTTPIDANTVRGNDNTTRVAYNDHDSDPGIHVQSSTLASRPVAGTAGRKWITEDSGIYTLWFDDGTNWHPVSSENVAVTVLAGETLAKGDVVKITGWNNGQDLAEVVKTTSASDTAFAVMTAAVSSGTMGYATNTGIVQDVNTAAYSVGTILYANGSGGFTSTKPTSGNYQPCAFVLRSNVNNGVYYVEFSAPRIVERSDNTASTVVLRDASGNFSAGTITATAVNATTLDLTNLEVTNIKAKDGTQAIAIADVTGVTTFSAVVGATLSTAAQPNITSVGTLSSLMVNGNTIVGAEVYRSSATSYMRLDGGSGSGSGANFLAFGETHATNPGRISITAVGAGAIQMNTGGALRASIDNTGNLAVDTNTLYVDAANNRVGIGTASPASALDVNGAARLGADGASVSLYSTTGWRHTGSGGLYIDANQGGAANSVVIRNGSGFASQFELSGSGNLGLGVTPSAWNSGYKALQVLTGSMFGTTSRDTSIGANVFVNSSGNYAYIQSSFATVYTQFNGAHSWSTAPSGTAGNAITFTQAMTLDANSNLTVSSAGSQFVRMESSSGSSYRGFGIGATGDSVNYGLFQMRTDTGEVQIKAGATGWGGFLTVHTNGSERARIAANGDFFVDSTTFYVDAVNNRVGVLTTSPTQGLDVNSGFRARGEVYVYNTTGTDQVILSPQGTGSGGKLIAVNNTNTAYTPIAVDGSIVVFQTSATERARITASGQLCVGAGSAPAAAPKFYVESNAVPAIYGSNTGAGGYTFNSDAASNGGTYYHFNFLDAGTSHGSISSNGTNTAYNTSSDVRLKTNIADADAAGAVIDAIAIRQFDWKSNNRHQRYGVIAQEVEPVFPEMVTKGQTDDDMWGVDYSTLVPMLVKEIQSLRGRVAALEA